MAKGHVLQMTETRIPYQAIRLELDVQLYTEKDQVDQEKMVQQR